jgi:hypothetical protein
MALVTGHLTGGTANEHYIRFLHKSATSPDFSPAFAEDQIDANLVYFVTMQGGLTVKVAWKLKVSGQWTYGWCTPNTCNIPLVPCIKDFSV